jgi:hypothetical protein
MLKTPFTPYSEKLRQATKRRIVANEYIVTNLLNKNKKNFLFIFPDHLYQIKLIYK